jgi:hypothetical protein
MPPLGKYQGKPVEGCRGANNFGRRACFNKLGLQGLQR